MPPRSRRTLLLTLPWAAAVALWLGDALAAPDGLSPGALDAAVAWVAVAAAGVGAGLAATRLWRDGWPGRTLLALLALATVTCCTGLAQELLGRYFGDEGIYLAQARRINDDGQLLRPWFIYPHLLFYLDAFALWLGDALGPVVPLLARWVYGVEDPAALDPLVTRMVTAAMGAGTVVPVFVAARRMAGPAAAALGGALVALCPLYVRVAHLNISDVAGAFFAAMTFMQCALLVERDEPGSAETRRGYLLAGLWAGLAAGGKYPAGVVAVAVAGVWAAWRLRGRRPGGGPRRESPSKGSNAPERAPGLPSGLLWAAGAAVVAFLGTTPSFLAFPGAAYAGEGTADVLFGFRQYAQAGWTGVVRASNTAFYLDRLVLSFGVPALLLGLSGGLSGIARLDRRSRRRLLWLAPFPVAYLALVLTMRIAVDRNLLPVLPALAAVLGAGLAGWTGAARTSRASRLAGTRHAGSVLAVLVAAVALAPPAWRSAAQTVRFARPTTRELAARWIPEHLPPGSALVQEVYTPIVRPERLYPAARPRFVVRMRPEELRDPRFDFVFVASDAYGRFFQPEALDDRYEEGGRERYEEIFETFEPVAEWAPGRFRAGPRLRLYRLDPETPPWSDRAERGADELLTLSPAMRTGAETGGPVIFRAAGQWALAKAFLEPGSYEVGVDADAPAAGGGVQVLTRAGEEVAVDLFFGDGTARVELPRRDKYFVYVRLPPGSVLRRVRLEATGSAGSAGGTGEEVRR
jgi:hypothetical protein